MANITETEEWIEGIYQLEEEDLVLGGPDGIDNLQAKQLAARTRYLKALVEALGLGKQPLDAMLSALAALVTSADKALYFTGPDAPALTPLTAFMRTLLGSANAAAARVVLDAVSSGELAAAVAALVDASPGALDTLNELAAALGDDANFATTITNALATKAPLSSPLFVDAPRAPTPAQFDNGTLLATTAFVQRALGSLAGAVQIAAATIFNAATHCGKQIILNGVSQAHSLPAASTFPVGGMMQIIAGNNANTIQTSGADVINFSGTTVTSLVLNVGDSINLISLGGVTWLAVSGSHQLKYSSLFGSVIGGAGYQKLPSGLIVQWGSVTTGAGGAFTWTYPIAFPNSRLSEAVGLAPGNHTFIATGGGNSSRSGTLTVASTGAGAASGLSFQMIAIGN